jgi:DNA-binding CsgD family transcriptional regulator
MAPVIAGARRSLADRRNALRVIVVVDGQVTPLSPRQGEILDLLGRGLVTKEIAARLGIGVKTVETHRTRLMQVLKLRRSHDLLRYAVLHGTAAGP